LIKKKNTHFNFLETMGKSSHKDRSRSKDRERDSKKKHKKDHKKKREYSSSSSSSSSSRSRSSSSEKTRKNRNKDKKRDKDRDNKRRRHSRSYSSKSASRSRSPKRSLSKERDGEPARKRFSEVPKNIRNPNERTDDKGRKRFSVNNFALAELIMESKRTNQRLDQEEVARANVKFKKYDHSERQATLLSGAINTDEIKNTDEYTMEYRNGEYVKVQKPYICGFPDCGMRFALSLELNDHLKKHDQKESQLNSKKAQQFFEKMNL